MKLNILLLHNALVVLLGVYLKELKAYIYTKACTGMFIAAFFIINKTWMQPRCPSVGEWSNKLWYAKTMEYYSALKIKKFDRS